MSIFTIELRLLEGLNLSDGDVVNRVDELASFLDLFTNVFGNELSDKLSKVDRGGFLGDDFNHLLSDSLDLRHLGV